MPPCSNHSSDWVGSRVDCCQSAASILHLISHMPNAQCVVRIIEYSIAIRLTNSPRHPPVHLDFTQFLAIDYRNFNPDGGNPIDWVPFVNLVGHWQSRRPRESDIFSIWFGLIEIKIITIQPHKNWAIFQNGGLW